MNKILHARKKQDVFTMYLAPRRVDCKLYSLLLHGKLCMHKLKCIYSNMRYVKGNLEISLDIYL